MVTPDWLQISLPIIIGGLVAGIGWLFKVRREDRNTERARRLKELDDKDAQIQKLQERFMSLMVDQITQTSETLEADKEDRRTRTNLIEIIAANTTVLKEIALMLAELRKRRP